MAELDNDELNINSIEEYFQPMHITRDQRHRRERMAGWFEDEFLFILSEIAVTLRAAGIDMKEAESLLEKAIMQNRVDSLINWAYVRTSFRNAYSEVYERDNISNNELSQYADEMAAELTRSTREHIAEERTLSYNRALTLAVNEAGTIVNFQEYQEAKSAGKTKKTWHTMLDNRVRDTHIPMEGITVPIDSFFSLEGGIMLYPRDSSLGASDTEICNCRCSCTYS